MKRLRHGIVIKGKVELTDGPPPPDGLTATVFWRAPGQSLVEYAASIARTLQAQGEEVTTEDILAELRAR